jgi:hypothetical protein
MFSQVTDRANVLDQIASLELQTTRDRGFVIHIRLKSDSYSEVIRCGGEIQMALRIEQNRRDGLSTGGN